MAECVNCGRSVSYQASTCPGCGQSNPGKPRIGSISARDLMSSGSGAEIRRQREREAAQREDEAAKHAHYHRECPMCAEQVKKKAKVCKHCGHTFDDYDEVMAQFAEDEAYAAKHSLEPWQREKHRQQMRRKAEEARLERQRLCEEHGCTDDELDAVLARLKAEEEERAKARERKARAPLVACIFACLIAGIIALLALGNVPLALVFFCLGAFCYFVIVD